MSAPARETIETALAHVTDRDSGKNVIESGLISGLAVEDGKVRFLITIALADKDRKAYLRGACEAAVKAVPGVTSVTAVLTAQSPPPEGRKPAQWNLTPVEHVKKIVAVASGKGGVGKSTTAVNLALALAKAGKRAGVLDADIYGPSIPHMLGLSGQPEIKGNKMLPLINHGVVCNSIGFITGDQATILRGPMVSKALHQLLRSTQWGTAAAPLDILIVDMPPGTGDTHLSLTQAAPLDGAVIVTTPQAVAVIDAHKCLAMFQKVNVPVLGVVENMSGELFGRGGGKILAEKAGVPFLGAIPADAAIREASDSATGHKLDQYAPIAARLMP